MLERPTRVSFSDYHQERTIEPMPFENEMNLNSDSSSENRSCFTSLQKWCRNIFRRTKHSNSENNQQVEPNQLEVNVDESIQEKNITPLNSQRNTPQRNLFPFKRPYRTIKITDKSSVSIACSDKYILVKQSPNLCLFDKQLNIVKEIPWAYEHVDICWSSTLRQFILVTEKVIFTFDENTMTLSQCPISLNDEKDWSCGACSDTSLYLSIGDTSASLYEYTLQPTIKFVKEWQLFALHPTHEGILTFTYANGKLALIISNIHIFQRRLDLRSSTTLERLWSIPLEAIAHCCSINNDQWIIMELLRPRLLHISSDGKILQTYNVKTTSTDIIWNAIQLDKDTIATFTMETLDLHKL